MKEIFLEIDKHLTEDLKPSLFLINSIAKGDFDVYPLNMISRLKKIEQSPVHHPEGNVLNHTMLVVDWAAKEKHKSKNPRELMWAALLHDIGKAVTTKERKGKITAYNHDIEGEKLSQEFLDFFGEKKEFIKEVSNLVRYHMQVLFVVKNMRFADIEGMKENVDVKELALLGFCDRMGRGKVNYEEEEDISKTFLEKIK